MNKIFKIVFNAARGKMIVVNEAASSVQTGKKAAVTVAVIGALMASTGAMAVELTEDMSIVRINNHGGPVVDIQNKDFASTKLNGHKLTVNNTENAQDAIYVKTGYSTLNIGDDPTTGTFEVNGDVTLLGNGHSVTAQNFTINNGNIYLVENNATDLKVNVQNFSLNYGASVNAIQVDVGGSVTINADSVVVNSGRNAIRAASNSEITITAKTMEVSTTDETRNALESESDVNLYVDNATFNGSLIVGGKLDATGNFLLNDDGNEINTLTGQDLTLTIGTTGDANKPVLTITDNQAEDLEVAAAGGMSIEALADTVSIANGAEGVKLSVAEGDYTGAASGVLDADGKLDAGSVKTQVNSIMSNTLDLASAAPLAMNRLLMNDVRKRMGDLRAAEGTHGVWARYDGGKLKGSNALENDFTTVQVGIDTVPVVDAPRFGVAFAYTQSDADMKRGGAEMDAFSLAFYGTKFYDNGMFVDVIGRMATADTDVVVDGNKKGSMDNVALSLSGELGWRFDVTDKFYFEPQAELTYTYVNADTLTLANGGTYEFDSVDSLMARVGFAAGFKCPSNFGDVYVRASAVHEFLGDAVVRGGTELHEVDGKDTWVEYGIGANFNINKNTYVYADIERTEGAALDEDWRANVGVRFAF